jgi:Ca-activated chloride channel family protein
MRYAILVLSLALFGQSPVGDPYIGLTTGTVQGTVADSTGKPLAYANVVLVGTMMGAMTLPDGKFAIVQVPPGTYRVRAMMMGYKAVEVDSVVVTAGLTTRVDFAMGSTVVLKTQAVVLGERALVEVTESRVTRSLTMQAMPVGDALGGVGLKAGAIRAGDDLHVRGGRGVDAGDPWAPWRFRPPVDREQYEHTAENEFLPAVDNPLSTFSIDVDRASYANMRRMIREGRRPPAAAIRIEEMVNYFEYDNPGPAGDEPFAILTDVAGCPWAPDHRLVRIGLQGRRIETKNLPPSNLVFLIDVSGSMQPPNKLALIKAAFPLLVEQLRAQDRVAIVVYAGSSGLVLESTPGDHKRTILDALERLQAGGSTAGGEGIVLAYKVAQEHFTRKGNNRVILATDGDFNVGVTSDGELVRLIEEKRTSGVFLTVLAVGEGNLQDAKMEKLADHGNGNYAYLDDILEAQKVFVNEMGGTLVTIAKDVKIQVEFNPARVESYRLIGYENRMLKREDFEDDRKDAGELGAGHAVTALYEIVPAAKTTGARTRKLRYTETRVRGGGAASGELLTVRLRYKAPDGDVSREIERTAVDGGGAFASAPPDFRFAAAVAEFGMLLRDSAFKGGANLGHVIETARSARGHDPQGYRSEFVQLVETCQSIAPDLARER